MSLPAWSFEDRGDAGHEVIPGEFLIQLAEHVGRVVPDGDRFGIAALDEVGVTLEVVGVEPILPIDEHGRDAEFAARWLRVARMYRVTLSETAEVQTVVAAYEALEECSFAEPHRRYYLPGDLPEERTEALDRSTPHRPAARTDEGEDPWFEDQWNLEMLGCPAAWDSTTGSPAIVGVILDRDFDWDHEDLKPNVFVNPEEDINADEVVGDFAPPDSAHTLDCCGSELCCLPSGCETVTPAGACDDLGGTPVDDCGDCTARTADPSLRPPLRYICPGPGFSGDGNGCDDDWDALKLPDDLLGWNWIEGSNNVDYGAGSHGTSSAGVFAARTQNGKGIAGVAGGHEKERGAGILPAIVPPTDVTFIQALVWAVDQEALMGSMAISTPDSQSAVDAVEDAWDNGFVLFLASRNDCNATDPAIEPICTLTDQVFCVGAAQQDGNRWVECWPPANVGESNYGDGTAIYVGGLAPAESDGIPATTRGGGYSTSFGRTSAATPQAMGVAALVQSYVYERSSSVLDPATLVEVLKQSAIDIETDPDCPSDCDRVMLGPDIYTGAGRLHAARALTLPKVMVTTPNGGEVLEPNEEIDIGWRAWDINGDLATTGSISLYYSSDAKVSGGWTLIAAGLSTSVTDVDDNTYAWTVPTTETTHYRIKIEAEDEEGHVGTDLSDDFFTVETPDPRTNEGPPQVSIQPNPSLGRVVVHVGSTTGVVRVVIFDPGGRRVWEREVRARSGEASVAWDGSTAGGERAAHGVYFVQVEVGAERVARRLVVLRP